MQWTVLLGKFDFIIITFSFWLSTGIFRRSCNSCHVLGCEIWSFEIVDIITSLLLRFLNFILNLKSSIPNIIGICRNWTLWYRFGEDWYSEMCRIIHIHLFKQVRSSLLGYLFYVTSYLNILYHIKFYLYINILQCQINHTE